MLTACGSPTKATLKGREYEDGAAPRNSATIKNAQRLSVNEYFLSIVGVSESDVAHT